jgi:hypothetical protein
LTKAALGMSMPYRHTQLATVILLVCFAIAVLGVAIAWVAGPMPAFFVVAIQIAVAVVFHSLTVEIGGGELRWHFGPGFWSYRLALDEIRSVAVVRNHWWNGFGIRTAPGFRLYNVSGLDAVEIKLKSGDIRRIGTDDPEALAAALSSAARGG